MFLKSYYSTYCFTVDFGTIDFRKSLIRCLFFSFLLSSRSSADKSLELNKYKPLLISFFH